MPNVSARASTGLPALSAPLVAASFAPVGRQALWSPGGWQ
jgi:hypothetical protein